MDEWMDGRREGIKAGRRERLKGKVKKCRVSEKLQISMQIKQMH